MNRFKLFLILLIVAVLGIVFVQNREPLVLKILCPDQAQSCLYQTPQLPLAIWIGLFILAGITTNLLWQVLSRFSYSSSRSKKSAPDNYFYDERENLTEVRQDQEQRSRFTNTKSPTVILQDSVVQERVADSSNYEIQREPQNVERSGSTYSYKYKEASDRKSESKEDNNQKSIEPNLNKNINTDKDDEDWI
jgi:hypothetical protein